MTLGEIIKQYRKDHGMSMGDFEKASGITKGYISMLERNTNPKTGEAIKPSVKTIQMAAKGMFMSFNDLFNLVSGDSMIDLTDNYSPLAKKAIRIPVLGRVAAGIPISAVEDVLDYEEVSEEMAHSGELFALKIKGDSMEPIIRSGSVVIVRQQDDADHGDVVIAMVNGDDATCKRLLKYKDGIRLMPENPTYEPLYFTNEDIQARPVRIIGKVIEERRKFE